MFQLVRPFCLFFFNFLEQVVVVWFLWVQKMEVGVGVWVLEMVAEGANVPSSSTFIMNLVL